MRNKTYTVKLTDEQRDQLNSMLHKGVNSARKLDRARILLIAEQDKEDKDIAKTIGVTIQTVSNIRKRFFHEGLESALNERPRPGAPLKLDAKGEAYAIATACSNPPEGRICWTMQMIADKLVELKYVDSISDDTIRLRLKKKRQNHGCMSNGVSMK
jgi:transposase